MISMIAKFRFVFWENETIRDLRERERERELVTYERLRFFLKKKEGWVFHLGFFSFRLSYRIFFFFF